MMTQFDREIELAGIKDEMARELKQIEYDIVDLRKQGLLVGEKRLHSIGQEHRRQRRRALVAAKLNSIWKG